MGGIWTLSFLYLHRYRARTRNVPGLTLGTSGPYPEPVESILQTHTGLEATAPRFRENRRTKVVRLSALRTGHLSPQVCRQLSTRTRIGNCYSV